MGARGPTFAYGGSSYFNIPEFSYYRLVDSAVTVTTTAAVPEPASAALLALGAAALVVARRRRDG